MSEKKPGLWSLLGKITAILSVIWVATQLYNNFIRKEYSVSAIGNNSPFYLPSDFDVILKGSTENAALKKFLGIEKEKLDRQIWKKIQGRIKKKQEETFSPEGIDFEFSLSQVSETVEAIKNKYGRYWWYTITNAGQKELEGLVLDLSFDGYFIAKGTNYNKFGSFKNRIELGNFGVQQQILVQVWQLNDSFFDLSEKKDLSRLIHKNGWQKIEYPAQVTGLIAWNKDNDDLPLYFGVLILIISYIVVFSLGEKYAPMIRKWDRKLKLEDLKKLKELEKEELQEQRPEPKRDDKKEGTS
jgi:hypothetical protein